MVLPEEVQYAAANGQLDTIKDWLESGNNDVNEVDSDRLRSLIARGRATVRPHGWTPSCVARLFARSLPNEIAWRVLEYWNPRY